MDAEQLRKYIVGPALAEIGMWSEAAEDLVMGTAAQESHLKYVRQFNDGPARGMFQMEPATHDDIWNNWLAYKRHVSQELKDAIGFEGFRPDAERLVWDIKYGAMMCRIHYRRVSAPLPEFGDVQGYAEYWKEYYNTVLGAGTVEEFVKHWNRYILGENV
jgi:hypothetical protein